MRGKLILIFVGLVAIAPIVAACSDFDPDKLDFFHLNEKKKLPGERKAVFPEGVPGVAQGIPPDLVKGYKPPEPEPAKVAAPEPAKPKPRVVRRAPSKPPQVTVQPASAPPAAVSPQRAQQPAQQQQAGWPDPKPPASGTNTPWPAPAKQSSPWPDAPPPNTFQR